MGTEDRPIRILLVEDDVALSTITSDFLELHGFEVSVESNGSDAAKAFSSNTYDLCILDVMLPGLDGFLLAKKIRKVDESVPVVFLTARSMPEDRIEGFKSGCDDYILKPFSAEELILRIRAILKRCNLIQGHVKTNSFIKIGKYQFDERNMTLTLDDDIQTLTRREAELLKYFAQRQNQLLPRDEVLKAVWGTDDYFIGRSMDVFITRLRKRLKGDSTIGITNIHGSGFKLEVKENEI